MLDSLSHHQHINALAATARNADMRAAADRRRATAAWPAAPPFARLRAVWRARHAARTYIGRAREASS